MVDIEGPASQVSQIDHVVTDYVDAGQLTDGKEYHRNLRPPLKQVLLLRDEPVTIMLKASNKRR